MKKPSLVSLFSGVGGLDLGLEQAGFETLFANDIEPYVCESLRANQVLRSLSHSEFPAWFDGQIMTQRCYKGTKPEQITGLRRQLSSAIDEGEAHLKRAHIMERDIRFLAASEILEATGLRVGDIDLLAGGPPCQPFSRAGKKELVESETGQLFLEFVRMVQDLRPRWFLFENVKGLVQHKADVASTRCPKCHHFQIVEFSLREHLKNADDCSAVCRICGFDGIHPLIWDKRRAGSLDIIQSEFQRLGYACRSVVLNAADFGAPQHRDRLFIVGSRDGEDVTWPVATHRAPSSTGNVASLFDGLGETLPRWRTVNDALYQNGHWRYGELNPSNAVLWVKNVVRPHDEPVTWTLDRPAPTIGAHQSAKLAIAPLGVPEAQLYRQQWHVLGRRQGDTPPVFVEHEYLTDEELLTLQTFPTSWYLFGTRMQRAFQIGNAVPPTLARAMGQAILKSMGRQPQMIKHRSEFQNEERYASSF